MNQTDLAKLIAEANEMVKKSEKMIEESNKRINKINNDKDYQIDSLYRKYYPKKSQTDDMIQKSEKMIEARNERASEILNTTTDSNTNSIIIQHNFTKRPRMIESPVNNNLYKNQEISNKYTSVQKKNQITIDKPIALKNEISTKSFGNRVSIFFRNLFCGGKKKVSSISH